MPKSKAVHKENIFCYVCKSHVLVTGKDHKERLANFHKSGHDHRKVAKLTPGLSGKAGEMFATEPISR